MRDMRALRVLELIGSKKARNDIPGCQYVKVPKVTDSYTSDPFARIWRVFGTIGCPGSKPDSRWVGI